jgi:tight adherence protein B
MSAPVLSLLTFLAVVLGVLGTYSILADLFLRDRSRVSNRVDDEFRRKQRARAERSSLFRNLQQIAAEADAEGEGRKSISQRFIAMVEQSGLDVTPRKVLTIAAAAGLATGILAGLARWSPFWGAGGFLVGAACPILYVRQKKKARMEKLCSQLSDAFDLMARVIRAGQTMSQALLAVADEFDPPIAAEFSYCYEQQNLGMPPEATYKDLAKRNDLVEIKLFVLALLVQQQTGGNLAELLDKLAGVLRERYRIRGVVKTLTAEGRMQAVVLMAMPPVIFLAMLVLSHDYAVQLFQYPKLIGITVVSEGIGALWIRKIVNFEY